MATGIMYAPSICAIDSDTKTTDTLEAYEAGWFWLASLSCVFKASSMPRLAIESDRASVGADCAMISGHSRERRAHEPGDADAAVRLPEDVYRAAVGGLSRHKVATSAQAAAQDSACAVGGLAARDVFEHALHFVQP